ncbi:MAG: zinc ABC transporter substrate-binding protein [Syntrophomonadaceae bacterium]|nr:zinc ABC transporter substrate-binding protein [Syntrophomonadaceae bacterium]MDD4550364.1 zinc ABC transporter substrate-binding protein [Syntrophomonadaceae bacterium]
MIPISRNRKVLIVTLCLLVYISTLIGCAKSPSVESSAGNDTKPIVAVSVVPQESFVKAVAGNLVDTVVMIPPGYSPANYAPSPQEMQKLSRASLYFSIGVPTETANIMPGLKDINKKVKVVDLPAEVASVYPDREFAPGERDPHIWMSPKRVQVMVKVIARELSAIDPANEKIYKENADKYISQLANLDQELNTTLKDLPVKTFIIYHPAMGYFADDYGLKMVAIEEEGKEATVTSIQNIIDTARQENIKVIFYQASIASKQADAIAEEIGGRTEQVDPLAPDYINNMKKVVQVFASVLQ